MKLTKKDLKLAQELADGYKSITQIAVEIFGDKKYKHSAYMRMCRALKVLLNKK
jgi:hypothetical protein